MTSNSGDVFVPYKSSLWYSLMSVNKDGYGWCTWSVENNIAHMKWTRW
jgi:hypothetical protein